MFFSSHLKEIFDLFLHLDVYLASFFNHYGSATFILLFVVIFCETGLIITPFFPGDSLLFAAGSILATSPLSIYGLIASLIAAAYLGDHTNYWIGRILGRRAVEKWFSDTHPVLKLRYLRNTESFYQRHGLLAIFLARFIPIIRTFCPFIAGLAKMPYLVFASISLVSATFWVTLITYAGYRFGAIPVVKAHFSWVVLGIILISILPLLRAIFRRRF
jgi:membrane-associated protein